MGESMLRSDAIRTLLIASSGLVREGLAAVLRQTRFSVVANSTFSDDVDAFIEESSAGGLIIAAIDNSKEASLLVDLIRKHADLKLVVLVKQGEGRLLPPDLSNSASAILEANVSNEVLLSVLDLVFTGLRIQMSGAFSRVANLGTPESEWPASDHVHHSADKRPLQNLSPREVDILRGLSVGDSNKMIARNFDIAEATVKIHVKNILRKLKTQNRTPAAFWARKNGIWAQATPVQQSLVLAA